MASPSALKPLSDIWYAVCSVYVIFTRRPLAKELASVLSKFSLALVGLCLDYVAYPPASTSAQPKLLFSFETREAFENPHGLCVSPDGKIWLACWRKVLVFNGDGTFALQVQSYWSTATAVVFHKNTAFVADYASNSIVKCDLDGHVVGAAGPSQLVVKQSFSFPLALAIDPQGDLLVTCDGHARVRVFRDNLIVRSIGSMGIGPGEFKAPCGLAVSRDRIFVADRKLNRIQVFDAEGRFERIFGSGDWFKHNQLKQPNLLAFDNENNLLVCDTGNDRVLIFTAAGEFVTSLQGDLRQPSGVCVDSANRIFVSDQRNRVLAFAFVRAPLG